MSIGGNWDKRRVGELACLDSIDRRTFIKLSGASAAALIFGARPVTEKATAQSRSSDYPISLGISTGDPLPDGVVLWTRLAPDPLNGGGMSNKKIPVQWQVATDESFIDAVREGMEFARPDLAYSVRVEVDGLQPGTEYFYRFRVGPEPSPVGWTKTAPAAEASLATISFAFARGSRLRREPGVRGEPARENVARRGLR